MCLSFGATFFQVLGAVLKKWVELSQGYRAATRRQFTFYHQVPRNSWYSFDQPWKDDRV